VPRAFFAASLLVLLFLGYFAYKGFEFASSLPPMMGDGRGNIYLAVIAAIVFVIYIVSSFYMIMRGQAHMKRMLADRDGGGR
jgi:hypothetical protein